MATDWLLRLTLLTTLLGVSWGQVKIPVTFHALVPFFRSYVDPLNRTLTSKFDPRNMRNLFRDYSFAMRNFDISVKMTILPSDDIPGAVLNAFCDAQPGENVVTMFHINNPLTMTAERTRANKYINQLVDYLGIPFIAWDAEYSSALKSGGVSRKLEIAPLIQHESAAMMELLRKYAWSDFSIVTSRVPGYQDFIAAVKMKVMETQRLPPYKPTGEKNFRFRIQSQIILENPRDQANVRETLKSQLDPEARVFLVHVDRGEVLDLMDLLTAMNLTGKEYMWIHSSNSYKAGAGGRVSSSYPLGTLVLGFDSSLREMTEALNTGVEVWLTALNNLALRRSVLLATDLQPDFNCSSKSRMVWRDGQVLFDFLRGVQLRGPPEVRFNDDGILNATQLKILNVQESDSGSKRVEQVGTWGSEGLDIKDITWPEDSGGPPTGRPARYLLRVVTWKEEPYVVYRNVSSSGECDAQAVPCQVYERDEDDNRLYNYTIAMCCTGLSIDLLHTLSKELNFDYDLFEVADGAWGSKDPETKEWSGIIRILKDKDADMAVTALTIIPERFQEIDFSVPFLETGITIIVSIREGAISPTAFLEPYDYPSWCLILVFSVHATGASIFIFEWLSPFGLDQGKTPPGVHRFSLFRSFWLIWAMLFSAAVSTDTPRGMSSRFLANIWALFALVFLASYTANLAAFMITKEEYYDLSGIKDYRLTNPYVIKPPFKYATITNSSTDINILTTRPEMHRYMKPYNVKTKDQAVRALKKQEIQAFIYDATVLEYMVGKDDGCRLIAVGKWTAESGYGLGFPKGSLWVDRVNQVLLQLQDSGYIDRLQKFWLSGACRKKNVRGVSSRTLGILNFTSAYILLGGGILLAVLLLLLEHLYFVFGRKKLKKWDKCGCCALVSLSMGKSLTFEQSVIEAIDMHRRFRCKNPLCETQLWKVRHELDLALIKIDKLRRQLSDALPDRPREQVWQYNPGVTRQENGAPRRRAPPAPEPGSEKGAVSEGKRRSDPLTLKSLDVADSSPQREVADVAVESCADDTPEAPPDYDSVATEGEERPTAGRRLDGKQYGPVHSGVEMESTI